MTQSDSEIILQLEENLERQINDGGDGIVSEETTMATTADERSGQATVGKKACRRRRRLIPRWFLIFIFCCCCFICVGILFVYFWFHTLNQLEALHGACCPTTGGCVDALSARSCQGQFLGKNSICRANSCATTAAPTSKKTASPTRTPTSRAPTVKPSSAPTTRAPTNIPTTIKPTRQPSSTPTTRSPTAKPSVPSPTFAPSSTGACCYAPGICIDHSYSVSCSGGTFQYAGDGSLCTDPTTVELCSTGPAVADCCSLAESNRASCSSRLTREQCGNTGGIIITNSSCTVLTGVCGPRTPEPTPAPTLQQTESPVVPPTIRPTPLPFIPLTLAPIGSLENCSLDRCAQFVSGGFCLYNRSSSNECDLLFGATYRGLGCTLGNLEAVEPTCGCCSRQNNSICSVDRCSITFPTNVTMCARRGKCSLLHTRRNVSPGFFSSSGKKCDGSGANIVASDDCECCVSSMIRTSSPSPPPVITVPPTPPPVDFGCCVPDVSTQDQCLDSPDGAQLCYEGYLEYVDAGFCDKSTRSCNVNMGACCVALDRPGGNPTCLDHISHGLCTELGGFPFIGGKTCDVVAAQGLCPNILLKRTGACWMKEIFIFRFDPVTFSSIQFQETICTQYYVDDDIDRFNNFYGGFFTLKLPLPPGPGIPAPTPVACDPRFGCCSGSIPPSIVKPTACTEP